MQGIQVIAHNHAVEGRPVDIGQDLDSSAPSTVAEQVNDGVAFLCGLLTREIGDIEIIAVNNELLDADNRSGQSDLADEFQCSGVANLHFVPQ